MSLAGLQDTIAKALVRALQTCPDVVPMRKELLVATRHGLMQLKAYVPSPLSSLRPLHLTISSFTSAAVL